MSRIYIKVTIVLALISLIAAAQEFYKKIIHNTDSKAKCLDGSSPALYIHQGAEKNKFLIYFQGGGMCIGTNLAEVIQNCYTRSKSPLGSSKNLPDTVQIGGYLSTDPSLSKFAGWTKILILYCDGSLHQGSSDNSVRYKDAQLFFRGADNVRSHLKWLTTNYGFADAQTVLLTGTSAGGVATYLWSNYVGSLLANPRALYSVVDSGIFINAPSPQTGMFKLDIYFQNLYKISNANEKTPIAICNRYLVGEEYKCLFIQYSFSSVTGAILLVNSQYDSWSIQNIIDIKCLKDGKSGKTLSGCNSSEIANIEVYRKAYLNFLRDYNQFSKNGIWTISCSTHGYAVSNDFYNVAAQKVPETTGETVKTAIERFVFDNQRVTSVDQQPWPSNKACAN